MLESEIQNPKSKIQNHRLRIETPIKILNLALLSCVLFFIFLVSSLAAQQFTYDDKDRRNPFIPLVTADGRIINLDQQTDSELQVEGIIYDERGFSYAIVNQAVVKIGDWIGNYRVLKIEKNKVIFLKDGQSIEVELKKEEE